MTSRLAITAAALALVGAALPNLADAQAAPPPVVLVRAGNLFDSEAGRMVGPRDILIRGERVAEVGQELTAPAGATVVDLRRCSVLPGLIDDASIGEAVEAGVTSIEHAYDISDETLRLMASEGVWLVPTDPSLEMALEFTRSWPQQPPREEVDRHLQVGRDRLMRAHRAGVRIALGSDLYFPYAPGRGAGSRSTMEGYVEAGLTPTQALQSATWEAGRMLGDDALGVIRARAFADLVAVEGDPTQGLAPLRRPRIVIKDGRVVAGESLACGG